MKNINREKINRSKNSIAEWTLNNLEEFERNFSTLIFDNSSSIEQRESLQIKNLQKVSNKSIKPNVSSFSHEQWCLLPVMEKTNKDQHQIFKKALQKLQNCVTKKSRQSDKATQIIDYDSNTHYPPDLIHTRKFINTRRRSEQHCPVNIINLIPKSDFKLYSEQLLSHNPSPKQNLKQKIFNEGQFQLLCNKLGMDQNSRTKVNTPQTEKRSCFKNLEPNLKNLTQKFQNDLVLLKLKQEKQLQSSITKNINTFFQQSKSKISQDRIATQSNHILNNENQEKHLNLQQIQNIKQIDIFNNEREKSTKKKMKLKRIKQFTLKDISLPEKNLYLSPLTKVSRLNHKIPIKF